MLARTAPRRRFHFSNLLNAAGIPVPAQAIFNFIRRHIKQA
jgi:hypothetical protein